MVTQHAQVVIVGAGMAGLSAARELLTRGWPKDKVVLLEASGRFGGRVSEPTYAAAVVYTVVVVATTGGKTGRSSWRP